MGHLTAPDGTIVCDHADGQSESDDHEFDLDRAYDHEHDHGHSHGLVDRSIFAQEPASRRSRSAS